MPDLLTALEIPNDAVGIVVHQRHQSPETLYRADIDNPDEILRKAVMTERELQEMRAAVKAMEAASLGTNLTEPKSSGIWLLYVIYGAGILALVAPPAAAIVWFVRRRRRSPQNAESN
ncbi:MAG: hypothetical protein F4Z35_03110 [Dehalococcoidia bacterium]|nr:hypothetical protein [Dehalococcoidia bacterium]